MRRGHRLHPKLHWKGADGGILVTIFGKYNLLYHMTIDKLLMHLSLSIFISKMVIPFREFYDDQIHRYMFAQHFLLKI